MLAAIVLFIAAALAQTHTFHFNATYVHGNPDGMATRRLIGINGQWPIPTIKVKKNDRVIIHYTNTLEDRNTSLHFHGLFQRGSPHMDGPEMVTQCPIPPGLTFTYNFEVPDQAGTYWYHSHSGAQYADGLRGMFIIEEDEPLSYHYDEEVLLSVSDYYHTESPIIMKQFLTRFNPTGAEPIPQNSLFNETKNATWTVQPNTTYLLRIVNMGLFTSQYLFIEDHDMVIVEADGVPIEPTTVDSIYLSVAQRYSVLIKTKESTNKNFRFVNVIDQEMLDLLPEELQVISTNWVVYDESKELPLPLKNGKNLFDKLVASLNPINEFDLTTADKVPLLPDPDYQIVLNFTMDQLGDGVTYAFFNNITYVAPKVPTLYSVYSSPDRTDARIYGSNTNTYMLQSDEVIEIVVNNMDPGKHPFHLHGHNFQIVAKSAEGDEENPTIYDPTNPEWNNFPEHPMVRDTVQVEANGFVVLRFKADNPGVWFFHCHVDWHLEQGLAITLVEAPESILHFDSCYAAGVPYVGNAAARHGPDGRWFDLSGENKQPAPLPEGFTLKGYFAMIVCTFVAIFGVISIYKYGMEDVNSEDVEATVHKLYKILRDHGVEVN
ncbi:iron transport multicopper oxidase FET3 precursor [Suhomyces tanzawaensis NRRL Y-17324]|uniref:Iron transport multicopper oxidase FET3 n=1 Tax=Suhomyces tanzawaensis NRRL Y-17324 TaxID=984487 RepID=A0A1E4SQ14_9ASCO|nr:iron transport multicopper oxidase FET3 precursor [Suhomyces tanzawaensis NRRL Y-17324]ODV81588.1 iron transport multicopper oxidase FET3 precursor [Suhomyces tanzawaensis NRRL Y-17324]